ncbi:hypothetical protein LY78DRAFT_410732 [Colletotrichum sublineola]|nr:hypothetical protein LY78DRAFT_410732 [Colletotrichum sublineola]
MDRAEEARLPKQRWRPHLVLWKRLKRQTYSGQTSASEASSGDKCRSTHLSTKPSIVGWFVRNFHGGSPWMIPCLVPRMLTGKGVGMEIGSSAWDGWRPFSSWQSSDTLDPDGRVGHRLPCRPTAECRCRTH